MDEPCRILVLEDRVEDLELAERELRKGKRPFVLRKVDTPEDFREGIEKWDPDLILCDFSLPGFDGLQAITFAKEKAPDTPVIMYTGTMSEETAVLCLKAGADDYILKDSPARLQPAVDAALNARGEREARRRAQQSLAESEERFRRLVETAHDAIVTFDATGKVEFVNPAGEATFGYRAEELMGQDVRRLFTASHGDLKSAIQRLDFEWAESDAGSDPVRIMGLRKDGPEFPMEVTLSGWTGADGGHYNAIIRDTTDRVVAEKALESLSRRHELLLNSAGEGIVGLDREGLVTFVNPAALNLLERDASEVLGETVHEAVCSRSRRNEEKIRRCPLTRALGGGLPYHGDLEFRRGDEATFTAAASLTPILEDGAVQGAVLIFEDITERKNREAALRASEERYRGLVENAAYGIYRSSLEGFFQAVNPALVEMLGYDSPEDLLALDMRRDLYRDPAERERLVRAFLDQGRVVGAEMKWLRADGTPLDVRLSGRGIWDEEGEFEAFEVVVEDLSERKKLEDQLRQAQKMEAVGQLTGGIAHDFNNVLSVILLNSEILSSTIEEGEPPDAEDLNRIRDAAKRAASITRKLLTFSRQAELSPVAVRLETVVDGLRPMLRTLLPEDIELDVKYGSGLEPVLVDVGSVEQILMNLAGNSRDAMPGGGALRVEVYEAELDQEYCRHRADVEPGRFVCMEVSDTGCGMDANVLQRVFDPFFTTKEPGSGTGLGMAMVYGLAKQQGGHVSVYSQVDQGTVIRVYFPLLQVEEEDAGASSEVPHEAPAPTGTILLVEDEENLRLTTEKALLRAGYEVLSAEDGARALEVFRTDPDRITLVLSDLVLPGMGGLDLYRRIRDEFGPVRFILTSGYSPKSLGKNAGLKESLPFIRKPWILRDLLAVIRRTLGSEPLP